MSRRIKHPVALALALAALSPAAAQAKFDLNPPPQVGPSPQRPARVVATPAGHSFDWGDASIGAGAGLGLAALTVGGSLVVVGRRRTRRYATATGVHA